MTFQELLARNGIRLSAEQEAAVYEDRAAVVSAGAGAGKTTVLSLRFVRLVMERKAHSDQIMTLTFTKKAAAEMYERIYRLLGCAAEGDGYLKAEMEEHFPKARISTLDSFWSEIARTDSMRYGVMRDFTLLEDDDAEDMARRIFIDMEDDAALRAALEETASFISSERLLAELVRIASVASDVTTPFSAEENARSAGLFAELASDYASGLLDEAVDALEAADSDNPENTLHDAISEDIRRYRSGGKASFDYSLRTVMSKRYKELRDAVKGLREVLESVGCYLHGKDLLDSYVRPLSIVIEGFIGRLQAEKRRRGALTFHDTEVLSRKILLSNLDVRDYYKRKYRYIMIDEFQDNNSSQRDLLFLLAEKPDAHSASIPSPEDLEPDKLFFVGDDKQSIYYFRGADVSVFRELNDDIRRMGGNLLSLTMNYRSEPGLIGWFSSVFSSVFSSGAEPDPEEQLLSSFTGRPFSPYWAEHRTMGKREPSPGISPRIVMASLEAKPDPEMASPGESEAVYIADMIERMVSSDDFLVPGKDGPRRPSLADIAVLLQTTAGQRDLEKVFRMRGIGYAVAESSSITTEAIASDIYSFLQCLAYPDDKLAYTALLRSPFARISDEGLLFLADRGPACIAFAEEPSFERDDDRESFRSLARLYAKARAMVGRMPIAHILDTIYYEGGYHAYLASRPELAVYEDHFSYLWEVARRYDGKGRALVLFLDYLRPLLGQPEKLAGAAIQHFEENAVSIMTIHRSKGLQFPIVFLADSQRGASSQSAKNKLAVYEGRNPLIMVDPEEAGSYPFSRLLNNARARREEAERDRLLYVALTRASAHLVITGVKRRNSEGSLFARVMGSGGACIPEEIHLAPKPGYGDMERVPAAWYDKEDYPEPVSSERRIGVRASLIYDSDNSWQEGKRLPSLPSDSIIRARGLFTQFGIMAHEAVESAIEGREPAFSSIPGLPDSEYRALEDDALAIRLRFISSGFYAELVKGRKSECEVRFYYPDGDSVIEGSADLIAYDGDSALVVDFKTDSVMCPEEHLGQITRYAQALTELEGVECRCTLLYLRSMERSAIWDKEGNVLEG